MICENVLYYFCMMMGLYTVHKIHNENSLYEHPFEEVELADGKGQNMGTDVEIA